MKLTAKQLEAQAICAGPATHCNLFGGSRSGKTFLHVRNTVFRGLKAPGSRHGIFRFRFNHLKASIGMDTLPKVMAVAFPDVRYDLSKTDWVMTLPGKSQVWLAGLDDKERTEKILGQEFATLYFNECSQIPVASVDMALTRLAQRVVAKVQGRPDQLLRVRAFYDENPPNKAHWTYRRFVLKQDPETRLALPNPDAYAWFQINPRDNEENLSPEYMATLESLPARMRKRFLDGEFADANPNQLFAEEDIDAWRVLDARVPDMVRVVVAVDPSGSGDVDNADNDAIGIVVVGLGTDGNAYVLADCTVKAGPATWSQVAGSAFDRFAADVVVGEVNFGGAMVEHTIQTARPRTPYKAVNASRGKVVRAEPFSPLYAQGKVRHVGNFPELEDELMGFSTVGYVGGRSPNRADALIWALTELFPGIVNPRKERPKLNLTPSTSGGWQAM